MKLDISLLTDLAVSVSNKPDTTSPKFALMASHVAELVENSNTEEAMWILAASLTYLLVENFNLEQQLLELKNG